MFKKCFSAFCLVLCSVSSVVVGAAELRWLGQAGYQIKTNSGKVILIDPFITHNPKAPKDVRDLKGLGKVDLILVTHGHKDHFGDTLEISRMTGAKIALNADLGTTLETLKIVPEGKLIRFNKGATLEPIGAGIKITMVRAEHSSSFEHPHNGVVENHPGGEPAGYIIELEDGYKIYHAGDTGVFADMVFIGGYYSPDLALLPIGGHFTMDPKHAAYAVNALLKPKVVIPMHYGTFPILAGTPKQFKAALGKTKSKLVVLEPGDTYRP
ncbi:metal-dependent hydrolase [uncultured Pseudoteredinibacter sp.]|uniref:metal-dependent hydrolase n=1 Tax=uncultured Pseudoteredinibacter sp. TaxID=1641701 RepID=UPI0026330B5C|nr:metal-dependent hydrolase [uncultured Pseudoteredinibacter sp.]